MQQHVFACLLAHGSSGRSRISTVVLSYFQNYIESTVVVYKRLMSGRDHHGTNRLAMNSRLTELECCIHLIVSMLSCMSSEINYQLTRMSQGRVEVEGVKHIGEIARTS